MAKARSRSAARKVKDKWKAKNWYNVLAPASFDHVTIAETLADEPDKLVGRVTEVSLQDLTNDFRRSHIKLFFRISSIEDGKAHTEYIGHTLTSDYLRRMIRRKRSKIDAVYDVTTRDGATLRIKPFATTDRRIQNSQKRVIRETMKQTITKQAKASTLSEFVKYIIDGKIGVDIYKNCKTLYPVKRIEIFKTEIFNQPTIHIEEPKKKEPIEEVTEKQTPLVEEEPTDEQTTEEIQKEPSETTQQESEEPIEDIKESSKDEISEEVEPEESEEPVEEIEESFKEEISEEVEPEESEDLETEKSEKESKKK